MATEPRIALVSMPWASASRPSLGIGLLLAAARQRGLDCRAHYPNLDFSARLGFDAFEEIAARGTMDGVGEHLFATDVYGRTALASDAFLKRSARRPGASLTFTALRRVRDTLVPKFLADQAKELLDSGATVIGFTCLFNQVMPSVALAKRLKAVRPGIRILLGGGAVHGAAGEGYAAAFAGIVDHVFVGEADENLFDFLDAMRRGEEVSRVAGITVGGALTAPAVPVTDLDALATPNYDDYFATHARLTRRGAVPTAIRDVPFESSRGCWWGEKNHCTFCGLNNEGMASRNKSPSRIVEELGEISRSTRTTLLGAADNILTHRAYRDLLPRIADLGMDLRLFYEIKANVTRDQVAMLAKAGVLWVQPGVESFSDHVLHLMNKGVSAVQNIQLLKWLREYGISAYYNVLIGFPGEVDGDYEEMFRLLPRLFHLQAPHLAVSIPVEVHRFSPFFNDGERLGIRGLRARAYYRHHIPRAVSAPERYAYFFDRDIEPEAPIRRFRRRLDALLARWVSSDRLLTAGLGAGFVTIRESEDADRVVAILDGPQAAVFLLADAQTSTAAIANAMRAMFPSLEVDAGAIVRTLLDQGFLIENGGRVVNVVPFERPRRSEELTAWTQRWLGAALPG